MKETLDVWKRYDPCDLRIVCFHDGNWYCERNHTGEGEMTVWVLVSHDYVDPKWIHRGKIYYEEEAADIALYDMGKNYMDLYHVRKATLTIETGDA